MSSSSYQTPSDYIPLPSPIKSSLCQRTFSPLLPAPKRRRRRSSLPDDEQPDPIIGFVTSSGKFKCFDPNCQDISFGRQADFRRHYDHTHVSRKVEYYCTFDGCTRSRKPTGKSKGRSFGTREDKMKEHERTVHMKSSKAKRGGLSYSVENVEQGQLSAGEDQRIEVPTKRDQDTNAYQTWEPWAEQTSTG
jgi:hypothetical protein